MGVQLNGKATNAVGGGDYCFIHRHSNLDGPCPDCGDQSTLGPLPQLDVNTFSVGNLKFEALGDRLLIQEDEFKTGYECQTCGGSGKAACPGCDGAGSRQGKFLCSECRGAKTVTCPECKGKGGLLIAPEISQRRPTSGKIVSIGEKVVTLKVGDSVLYSNFSGYVVDLDRSGQPVTLRILHESEILCRMEGHLTLTNLRGKSEVAVFNN